MAERVTVRVPTSDVNARVTVRVGGAGTGRDGKNAYQLAVDAGFVGTVEEWLTSLRGRPLSVLGTLESIDDLPETGMAGDAWLIDGHFWVWVPMSDLLVDDDGNPIVSDGGDYVLVDGVGAWIDAGEIQGPAGDSAYERAVAHGFEGTEAEWLASLNGVVINPDFIGGVAATELTDDTQVIGGMTSDDLT